MTPERLYEKYTRWVATLRSAGCRRPVVWFALERCAVVRIGDTSDSVLALPRDVAERLREFAWQVEQWAMNGRGRKRMRASSLAIEVRDVARRFDTLGAIEEDVTDSLAGMMMNRESLLRAAQQFGLALGQAAHAMSNAELRAALARVVRERR